MSLTLDLYVPGCSWLHRLDPRVKLAAALLGLITTFLLSSLLAQALLLAAVVAGLGLTGVPWRRLGWVARRLALPVLLILLLQPLFTPAGRVLWSLGPVKLTLGGYRGALWLALRALSMAFVASGFLFTTDQRALVQALVCLGVPYTWGLTLSLTLRFLPAIGSLFENVRDAQAARGWVPEGGLLRRVREYLPVLVAVIIRTLALSDQLTLALAARGLGAAGRRTVWRAPRMRPADWITLLLVILAFALLLLARVEGWGLLERGFVFAHSLACVILFSTLG
ncbi:MAG: energy-coupling factor transporter transmembrane component T family protein [Anaerolineales bacterium]